MNILMFLPNADVIPESFEFWVSRDSGQYRLCIVSCAGNNLKSMQRNEIHELERILSLTEYRPRRRRLLNIGFSRLRKVRRGWRVVSDAYGLVLWKLFLHCSSTFVSNVKAFDPDVIDLRYVPHSMALETELTAEMPHVSVVSERNVKGLKVDETWRPYDSKLRVSIVLPVYNGAKYLRQSIESCLNQTYRNLELLIVDDCSTDQTPTIVAEYAKKDRRIVSLRNNRNLRLPRALNIGFAKASGELLTWTSHDNYYDPTAIETLNRYLCTYPNVDFVYSAFRVIDDKGCIDPNIVYLPPPCGLPYDNPVGPCFLYRKEVYNAVGDFREDMEYEEDYDYWVRTYLENFRMMRLHFPLYYYRRHPESMEAYKIHHKELIGKVSREYFSRNQVDRGSRFI